VPDYEVDNRFWPNGHFEGAYLFRDQLVVKLVPPAAPDGAWQVAHGWHSQGAGVGPGNEGLTQQTMTDSRFEVRAPFASAMAAPGIKGQVLLSVSSWG